MQSEVVDIIKPSWIRLAGAYSSDNELIEKFFEEIAEAYSSPGRYYHNLQHIATLLDLSSRFRDQIDRKNLVDFAIFYHDFDYDPTSSENETGSAVKAAAVMRDLGFKANEIQIVCDYILATRSHQIAPALNYPDLLWFLDFDLSILCADSSEYKRYVEMLRIEYAVFPNAVWMAGRKSFILETLSKSFIYSTAEFRSKGEELARANLEEELRSFN